MSKRYGVSVIVPTFRRPRLLERCLDALLAQRTKQSFEIIVADDGAQFEVEHLVVARADSASICLRYLPVIQTQGPAAARNAGAKIARYPLLAFTDDDCIPDVYWIERLTAAFDEGVHAVAGQVVVPLPAQPTDYERNESGLATAEFVTANCCCLKEVFNAVGGFDENFGSAWREDSDLHFKLLEDGYKIKKDTSAVVVHPVRPAPWLVSLKQQTKSMYDALLYKKHPVLYRRSIRPAVPWRYYFILALTVASLVCGIIGAPGLALVFLLAWATTVVEFAVRRLRNSNKAPGHIAEMLISSAIIPYLSVFWRLRGAVRFKVLFF